MLSRFQGFLPTKQEMTLQDDQKPKYGRGNKGENRLGLNKKEKAEKGKGRGTLRV